MPQFGYGYTKSDKEAMQILQDIYGETHTIAPFEAKWISENGGVLNCCSWTIEM